MQSDFDIIVVGSGPSGVHAAQEALENGARVGMIDVGNHDRHYRHITPGRPWSELRKNDHDQASYFLGDSADSINPAEQSGAHLTPARQFITRDTKSLLPIVSDSFDAVQSLALGGLGAGWGAGCACYENDELQKTGLPTDEMRTFYQKAADEIGISGSASEDISEHINSISRLQPPLDLDSNASVLMKSYSAKRTRLLKNGFKLGRPMAAVLSEPLTNREPNPYHDMDFWSDAGESVYRPEYTLKKLEKEPGFTYLNSWLVERFVEKSDGEVIEVHAQNTGTGQAQVFSAMRLLLAAGSINSARIVLRSLNRYGEKTPLLCNPYTYVPALNLPLLGRQVEDRRHSLVQLSAVYLPGTDPEDRLIAQFYSYRSLLLYRLASEMPLPPAMAMLFARTIVTSLVLVGINHPDRSSRSRTLSLMQNPGGMDHLKIEFSRSQGELKAIRKHEYGLLKNLLAIKLLPMNVIRLPEGASIHYAGTLPFSNRDNDLGCDRHGRLWGANGVYVADGSPWRFLPAKGLTLSLMANARRVAAYVSEQLK